MSKKIFATLALWLALFLIGPAPHVLAGNYNYADLQMKNFEEMQSRINARIKQAELASSTNNKMATVILRDALQLIFSRPNNDNMVSQLVPPVRTLLKNLEVYESTLNEISIDMIKEITNQKQKAQVRGTSLLVLNNLMSETKPEAKNNEAIRKIFIMIRDAKLKVADDVKGEMHLRSMLHAPPSPSDVAKKILEELKTTKE